MWIDLPREGAPIVVTSDEDLTGLTIQAVVTTECSRRYVLPVEIIDATSFRIPMDPIASAPDGRCEFQIQMQDSDNHWEWTNDTLTRIVGRL